MRNKICELKQATLPSASKIRYVTQIFQNSPLSSEFPKAAYPNFGSLLIMTLSKDEQTPLRIIVLFGPTFEEGIEASAHLSSRILDRIFTIERGVFFDHGREKRQSGVVGCCYNLSQILKH